MQTILIVAHLMDSFSGLGMYLIMFFGLGFRVATLGLRDLLGYGVQV